MDENIILKKMDDFSGRMDELSGRMDELSGRMDELSGRMDKRFDRIDEHLEEIDGRLDRVELDVRNINLTLENEIRSNISIIAENHTSLNQKLNEALHVESDRLSEHEIMKLKINHLDSEMKIIKERPNITA